MTSKEDQDTAKATVKDTEKASEKTTSKATEKVIEVVSYEIAGVKGVSDDFKLEINEGGNGARLLWKGEPLALIERGQTILSPKVSLLADVKITGKDATQAIVQTQKWLDAHIEANLKSLVLMDKEINNPSKSEPLTGAINDIVSKLLESLGIMDRALVEDKLKTINTEERKGLWNFKIKIGASTIFIPYILKPAPTQLRLMLWALYEKIERLPKPPTPGMVWVDMEKDSLPDFYRLSGYRPAGNKAVRVDMVERLADATRPLGLKGASFEVTPEIMGLVGLSGDDFAKVMNAIGYQSRKHSKKEEGKEEAEFYSFAWLGAKKPSAAKAKAKKPHVKKEKTQKRKTVPKKEFVPDPNSPFAGLAVLKDSMKKNQKAK